MPSWQQKIPGTILSRCFRPPCSFSLKARLGVCIVGTHNHFILTTGHLSAQMSSRQEEVVMCSNMYSSILVMHGLCRNMNQCLPGCSVPVASMQTPLSSCSTPFPYELVCSCKVVIKHISTKPGSQNTFFSVFSSAAACVLSERSSLQVPSDPHTVFRCDL
jgi:hypothetical protein